MNAFFSDFFSCREDDTKNVCVVVLSGITSVALVLRVLGRRGYSRAIYGLRKDVVLSSNYTVMRLDLFV